MGVESKPSVIKNIKRNFAEPGDAIVTLRDGTQLDISFNADGTVNVSHLTKEDVEREQSDLQLLRGEP